MPNQMWPSQPPTSSGGVFHPAFTAKFFLCVKRKQEKEKHRNKTEIFFILLNISEEAK